ncbi:MAG: pyridoxal phosphate-dependent aminotransferase [Acidobacteria bacterium]|nr:pyridoxal phosphate-dependent aminotransferase [Acidobacteriota bacterium]
MKPQPLNLNVRGLSLSATVAINEQSLRLIREGKNVARLGLGQSPFPVPAPVVEALRSNASRKDYLAVAGLFELREAVAEYHRRRSGTIGAAEDVLIGPGSKELMFLLQLVYYGELVIPTPAWVSYAPQAQIIGRRVSMLHGRAESGWRLEPGQLEELCAEDPNRPRIVVLNYPSNPTGGTYTTSELKELAGVARRFGILLLSDEIYGELHHCGEHVSIANFYPEGTIVSSGLSKWCGAGGWRLGTFAFPRDLHWLLDAMAAVASETYTSTSAPIQYAAVRAFRGGMQIERYLNHARRILSALGKAVCQRLRRSEIDVLEPTGAFYVFPNFSRWREELEARGICTSEELAQRLLAETGVAVLPGSAFGRSPDELTLRIAYVDFDGAKALAAVEAMPADRELGEAFLNVHCLRILEAMDRTCKWLESGRSSTAAEEVAAPLSRGAAE